MANGIINLEKAKKATGFQPDQGEDKKYVFAPNGGKNYALTLGGNTINLNQTQVDWIKDRYASEAAKSYGDTLEDLARKNAGALPFSFDKSYSGSALDEQLRGLNLPSSKYIAKYVGDYVNWYGDGSSYSFAPKAVGSIGQKFKADWEYEYTIEDQARKKNGQMPLAIEKKYGDNYRDYQLMQQGLPPEAMLSDYVGAFEKVEYETAKKEQLYDNVAIEILKVEGTLDGYTELSDTERIKIFDSVFSGSEYDDIRHLFDTSPAEESGDGVIDSLEELDKKWKNSDKKQSDEPTISWNDFANGFGKRKTKVVVDQTAYNNSMNELRDSTTKKVVNNETAKSYIETRTEENPAVVFADMYDNGVPLTQINNAKKHWKTLVSDAAQEKAIDAAFKSVQDQYSADRKAKRNTIEGAQGLSDALAKTYYDDSADRKAKRETKQAGDSAVKNGVVKDYNKGATSTINADDAEKIFNSHLVYDDKGKPTKESIALATNMLYEAGASTTVVLEVGKRSGMKKTNIFSKEYWENQKAIEAQAVQDAFDQTNGFTAPKVVDENKPKYDINGFDQTFSDVVAERDVAQRKELIDASYKANVESGNMTSAEFYNAVRRAGWGDTIDVARDAQSYYTEVYAPKFAKNGQQLPKWEEIDQAAFIQEFESGKAMNPEIHKTTEEIVQGSLSRAFMAPMMNIANSTISFVDMATAKASGRTETWDFTKFYNDVAASSNGVTSSQSAGSQIANITSTVAGEIIRMYTLSAMGSGVLSMLSKGAKVVSGAVSMTNAGNLLSTIVSNSATASKGASVLVNATKWLVSSSPFIATSMGSYYSEAMQNGANVDQAVLYGTICGALEGATESLATSTWLSRSLGANAVAKSIINGGKSALAKGAGNIATKAAVINLVASALGEGAEEMISYVGSWAMQRATYNQNAEFDVTEMLKQGGMGALIGLFGAGLNMGADTQANVVATFLDSNAGQKWAAGKGAGAVHDLLMSSVISDNLSQSVRDAAKYQDGVMSMDDFKATVNDITASSRQIDEGKKKFDTDVAKIEAALQVKKDAVEAAETKVANITLDGSQESADAFAAATEAVNLAEKELKVEQTQHDAVLQERTSAFEESTAQQNIALEKAQTRLTQHSVGIATAFAPEIEQLKNIDFDAAVLGQQILSKMDAARAGKLKEFVQAQMDARAQAATSPAQPAGEAQTVQAPTAQPMAQDATGGAGAAQDAQNTTVEPQSNIKSEATPANPAEMMGGVGNLTAGAMVGKMYLSDGKTAISQFVSNTLTRMSEAEQARGVLDAAIAFDDVDTYDVVTERESLAKAQERLARGITPEIIEELRTKQAWTGVDNDVAHAIRAAYAKYKNETGDANPWVQWSLIMTDRNIEGGRLVQSNAKYDRDTPEQAVVMMQRNVKKAENDAKTKDKKTTDSIKKDRDAVKKNKKSAEDSTADDIGDLVLDEKKQRQRKPKKETEPAEPTSIEELLAKKIIAAAKPKTQAEIDEVKQIVSDLFGKARQSPITPIDGRVTETPEQKVSRIYQSKSQYAELWQKAQDIVFEMAGDNAEIKQALSAYFVNSQIPDAPQAVLNALYQKAKKAIGIDIKNIIVKNNGIQNDTRQSIMDYLMGTVNLDADGALALSIEINKLFNQDMGKYMDAYLRSVYKEKYKNNPVVKSALNKLEEMSNATAFIDAEYADKIEAKLDEQLKRVLIDGGIRLSPMQKDANGAEPQQRISLGDIVARGSEATTQELVAYLDRVAGINVTDGDMKQIMESAYSVFKDAVGAEKVAFRNRLKKTNEQKAAAAEKMTTFERAIRAINMGVYDDTTIDATILAANNLPALTSDDAKNVMNYVEMAEAQTDEYMRGYYHGKAAKIIANTEPVTFGDKFRSVQRIMMLLNPRTMTRNIGANVINTGLEWGKDYIGVAVDKIVSLSTGERSTTVSADKYKAWAGGFKQGIIETGKDIKYGVHTGKEVGKFEMTNKDIWNKQWMNFLDELVKYGLSAGDHAFLMGARAEFTKAEEILGHDLNSEEVQQRISKLAAERVFQGNSAFAKRMKMVRNAMDGKIFKFGSLVLPFVETPSNIAERLIDYGVGEIVALASLKNSKATGIFDQKTFVDRMARGLTGKGLMIVGFALAKLGAVTLSPKDDEEKQMMKNAGITPYSLQIGDTSVAIDWASPAGSILLMGAALAKTGADGSSLNVIDGGKILINSFFNSTMLGNVTNLLGGNRGDVAGSISNFLLGSTTQFVPAAFGAIARVIDPYERDTYAVGEIGLLQTGKKLLAYFPGIRQALPFKYGTDGQIVKSNSGDTFAGRAFNALINPAMTDQRSDDPVNSEIFRLYQNGFDAQYLPVAEKVLKATVDKEQKQQTLTPEERNEYQRLLGEATYEAALAVVNGSSYDSKTDAQKATLLSEAISEAASDVRTDFKHQIGLIP